MQGGWGNVFVGQWTTPWADLDALWGIGTVGTYGPVTSIIGRRETTGAPPNQNCANGGSGLGGAAGVCDSVEAAGGVGHAFWRRISNSIHYQSPVFGGAQIKVAYQTDQDKSTTGVVADPSMWSGSVQWAGMGGRLRVGAALDAHKDFTTVGQTDTGWRVTGGWNFGVVDLGLAYETMTYKTPAGDCEAKQMGFAVAVPIGQGAIRGAFSIAKDIKGTFSGAVVNTAAGSTGSCGATPTAAAPSDDNGAKQWNLGYDYRFSKRTTVGAG
jgi:predicted porin